MGMSSFGGNKNALKLIAVMVVQLKPLNCCTIAVMVAVMVVQLKPLKPLNCLL